MIKVTFSFHVEEQDEIRCYMYWNGQTMRFHPVDIKYAFKYCFDENRYNEFDNNREQMKRFVEKIKIKDLAFEHFYKSLYDGSSKQKKISFHSLE